MAISLTDMRLLHAKQEACPHRNWVYNPQHHHCVLCADCSAVMLPAVIPGDEGFTLDVRVTAKHNSLLDRRYVSGEPGMFAAHIRDGDGDD